MSECECEGVSGRTNTLQGIEGEGVSGVRVQKERRSEVAPEEMQQLRGRGDGGGKKKKLVIKPFKSTPKVPSNFEEDAWLKLRGALTAVHHNETITISKEELYRVS